MPAKSAVGLINDFFAPPKVTMDELRNVSKEEREALADDIAKLKGLTKTRTEQGVAMYE